MHGQASGDERLDQRPAVLLFVGKHQVGPERLDRIHIKALGAAHGRNRVDHSSRLDAVVGPADQTMSTKQIRNRSRLARDERYHSLRSPLEPDLPINCVNDFDHGNLAALKWGAWSSSSTKKPLVCAPGVDGGNFLDPKRFSSVCGLEETLTIQDIQQALAEAGVEIYRAEDQELQIAERVRLHIMDSGVRVVLNGGLVVQFTARSQRSDAPSAQSAELFRRVREEVGQQAGSRGYEEARAEIVEVKDPVDEAHVLDVWHEVTYRKPLAASDDPVAEVRWALDLEKYIQP